MENDHVLKLYEEGRKKLREQMADLDRLEAKRKQELIIESESQPSGDPIGIQPDEFVGMKTALALEKYLRQRGGGPVKVSRLAADLALGGADLGPNPKWHGKNIRIVANSGKNQHTLRYDEATDTVSLVDKAVTPKPPGRARGPKP